MATSRRIAIIVGSLRKDSLNRKLAKAIAASPPPGLSFDIVDIAQLPLYNQDDDASPSSAVLTFKRKVAEADAVLFVTPEYNRSVPGVLKNAIDVGSRPYGKSAWSGKPAAVISLSPGAIGGFGANQHLRQSLVFLDMPALQQPEAYIGHGGDLFDDTGALKKPETQQFVDKFIAAFAEWIERTAKKSAAG
jgi:chromate reductase